jgi:undecaprenyl-diphosphatase
MSFFHAFLLAVLEGITEFLPISSTGHLILLSHFLEIPETDFLKLFMIVIQLGAIGAVIFFYWEKLIKVSLIKKLIVGFIPSGLMGFLFYKHIVALLGEGLTVAVMLLVGGFIIIAVELWYAKQKFDGELRTTHELSYKESFILGLFQIFALIPGTSRSASVIVGGLLLKLERSVVTEFAFLLAVPTMLVASAYSLYKNKELLLISGNIPMLIFGTLISFVVALLVIKWLLTYIKRHSFVPFGIYRIFLGSILLVIFLSK